MNADDRKMAVDLARQLRAFGDDPTLNAAERLLCWQAADLFEYLARREHQSIGEQVRHAHAKHVAIFDRDGDATRIASAIIRCFDRGDR